MGFNTMGLDLTVCPVKHRTTDRWLLYNRMKFERDYDLFGKIEGCTRPDCEGPKLVKALPVLSETVVEQYCEEGIERIAFDAFGVGLTYCLAEDFRKVHNLRINMHLWNYGILQMLVAFPPLTRVVLWWH